MSAPARVHLDTTLREVIGADDGSFDEGTWTALLHAAIDMAEVATESATFDGAKPEARRQILAVVILAKRALEMFDAGQAEKKETA